MAEPRPKAALEEAIGGAAPSAVMTQGEARIDVSAQLVTLEPGVFGVSVVAPTVVRTEGGMVLPCARFDPLPTPSGRARAFVSVLGESPLLIPAADPAYVRVTGGQTSVLLTIYKASGPMPPPEVHITAMQPRLVSPTPEQAAPADALPSTPLNVLAHVQNHGDLQFPGGAWAAAPDGQGAIEGFAVTATGELPAGSLEYQAVLGQDWLSPWMAEGEFCGSRQMALPLLGVRIRLRGPAAEQFTCQVWGRFGGIERGPIVDGAICEADGALLTGLRVAVVPRGAAADPAS